MKIHISYPYIKNNLTVAFSKKDKDEKIAAARKANSVLVSNPLQYLGGIPRYIELLKKGKATRALLKTIQLPVIVMQSDQDEIVSRKSLRYILDNEHIKVINVKSSGHYYYSKEAQEQILNILNNFISDK